MAKRQSSVRLRAFARPTLIEAEAPGRQFGVLHIEQAEQHGAVSSRQQAYAQIARGKGPTIAIIAQAGATNSAPALAPALVVAELMRELDTAAVSGRIRLVSCFTRPETEAQRQALQSALITQVLNNADLIVEIGGDSSQWEWCGTASTRVTTPKHEAELTRAARLAFGAPVSLQLTLNTAAPGLPDICLDDAPALPNPGLIVDGAGSLADACRVRGIGHVQVSLGGDQSEYARRDMIRIGCRNVLSATGVLDQPLTLRASRTLRCAPAKDSLTTPIAGALHLWATPGNRIYRGDTLACIVDPDAPWLEPRPIVATQDAVVVATRRGGIVAAGEAIALLADEAHD